MKNIYGQIKFHQPITEKINSRDRVQSEDGAKVICNGKLNPESKGEGGGRIQHEWCGQGRTRDLALIVDIQLIVDVDHWGNDLGTLNFNLEY